MSCRWIGGARGGIERMGKCICIDGHARRRAQLREIEHRPQHRRAQCGLRGAELRRVRPVCRRDGEIELKASIHPPPVDDRNVERSERNNCATLAPSRSTDRRGHGEQRGGGGQSCG